jgi:hypothetical protein
LFDETLLVYAHAGVEHVPEALVLDHAPRPDGAVVPGSWPTGVQGVRQDLPPSQVPGDNVAYGDVKVPKLRVA